MVPLFFDIPPLLVPITCHLKTLTGQESQVGYDNDVSLANV